MTGARLVILQHRIDLSHGEDMAGCRMAAGPQARSSGVKPDDTSFDYSMARAAPAQPAATVFPVWTPCSRGTRMLGRAYFGGFALRD